MRTIKFRGKRIKDGKWIYGDLVENQGRFYIYHACTETTLSDEESTITIVATKVQNETVGQFTGLYDKNGKEIYEGDIVQLDYITTLGKHRIGLSFEVKWCTQEGCWVGWDGFVENTLQQTHKMFVVKGNIYDNPELLKGNIK